MHFDASNNKARSCQGKRRHATYQAAMNALVGTGKTFGDLGLVVYRCDHCDGFHVGHPRRSVRRRIQYDRLLKLIDKANHS